MAQNLTSIGSVLEAALQNEQEGYDILHNARENVDNPLAKATFAFLADEELKHIDAITHFASALDGQGTFEVSELLSVSTPEAKSHIKRIFERFRTQFEAVAATDEPRMETYRVAMDMERRGHDFYKSAAESTDDPKAKRFYEFLAAEEIKHFELIQDTHDFLQQPDALLAVEERWMQT